MREDELLDAVISSPDDLAPRLIYADFLQKQGDVRGEFIALQCALTDGALSEPKRQAMATRERELLEAHAEVWLWAFGLRPREGRFRRGLIEEILLPWERLQHRADALVRCPVRVLSVHDLPRKCLPDFLALPLLSRLTRLQLSTSVLGEEGARALAQCPHLRGLTSLSLSGRLDAEGVRELLQSPHLQQLTELDLRGNRIGDAGARALAASPHLHRLTTLNLDRNDLSPESARALLQSPHLWQLTSLSLGDNALGHEGAQALAESPHLQRLTSLWLARIDLGPEGARALAQSQHLQSLSSLSLPQNRISDAGVTALAQSPHLQRLSSLVLCANGIGEEGARALAQSPHLQLVHLDVRYNDIGEEARALRARFGDGVML